MSTKNDRSKSLRKLTKKTRVLIPKPLRERLQRVLALVASSPRLDMLSGVQPFALLPEEAKRGLKLPTDSLQQLIERGAQGVCRIEGIGPQAIETLVEQLAKILGLEALEIDPPKVSSSSAGMPRRPNDNPAQPILIPIRGSVDAEVRLSDCFKRLLACPGLAAARNKQLKDFWEPGWPRAPFEEQFTLGQISTTKPEMLLKKRSFGPSKVAALIAAIDAFIEQSNVVAPGPPADSDLLGRESDGSGSRLHMHLLKGPGAPFVWHPGLEQLTFVESSVLRGYEHAVVTLAAQHPLRAFLENVHTVAPSQDFAQLLLAAELARTQGMMLCDPSVGGESQPSKARQRCFLALRKLFKQQTPEVYAHWEGMLRLPASKFSTLIEPYIRKANERDFMRTIGHIIAGCLQVKTPLVWGMNFMGYASFQEGSLEKFFNLILVKLPCSHELIKSEFEMLLSGVDSALLFECLKQRAHLDKQAKLWRSTR